MNNVEITKDEQHIKSKHRKLMFLFVIANLIFGNSAFAGNVIIILAIIAACCSTRDPFDEYTQFAVGLLTFFILLAIYLWFKFNSFKYIYQKAKALGESTSLYKFLNAFLYNPKVKALVFLWAVFYDCIIMLINALIFYKVDIYILNFIFKPGVSLSLFLFGGVTPSYIVFDLFGRDKNEKLDM